ncbi:MAG: NigD-like N-terminal domain-containing protein, partial [Tidjanibacter sp.]|nr:NigD-like N-terminal domain-containing protein [Tidjanibacter sp.]
MKNLFNIALTLFAAIALGTSCGVNEEITPVSQNFGTLIETPAGSKTPYYVLFDDGKSAYVTNTSKWNPTFGPNVSELRYLFSYEITNEQAIGYDYEITILSAKE